MKNIFLFLSALIIVTGCGGSGSKKKATSTQPTLPGADVHQITSGGAVGGSGFGSAGTSVVILEDGELPFSYGESLALNSWIELRYRYEKNGRVFSEGQMDLGVDYGLGGHCVLPKGRYNLETRLPGNVETSLHHYKGIVLEGVGAQSIRVEVMNALVVENRKTTEWVQDVYLKIVSVGGESCNGVTLRFGMPLR